MALRDRALNALRAFSADERAERDKADSPSAAAMRQHSPSMFSVWGREDIGGLLTVSQSLMDRFADYEAMEEYPDINCIAEGQRVYAVEGTLVKPVPIERLALGDYHGEILAFDSKLGRLVKVTAEKPRMTGRDVEVLALKLSNGTTLRCTPEHKILTAGDGYVDAKDLRGGVSIIAMWSGHDPGATVLMTQPRPGLVTLLEDPQADGKARVFDITTSTHNFVCEGAIVHNSAYHYYANDATQPSIRDGRTLWCVSPDRALQEVGNDLLHKKLRMEDEVWSMAYTTGMYGNDYEELLVTENGVIGLNHLPVPTMRRVERLDGGLIGFVQDVTGQFSANSHELRQMLAGQTEIPRSLALFEDWQVIHFRLRATRRRSPYGVSIAEGARWIWKRMVMLEDSVMIYKLTRAPARYAFYVDVTDIPSDRVEGHLKKMKSGLKKHKMVNPRTGRLDMRYNALARDEDFIIGVREGRELARVEVLSGPDYQAVDDVEYFKRMLHGSLRVPREYLGQEGSIPQRSILSNDDVRAARVTMNLQRELRNGFEQIVRAHLAARGMRNPYKADIGVEMTIPSGIWELAAYEVLGARADYASRVLPLTSRRYCQERVLKLTADEIEEIEKQQTDDAEREQDGDTPSYMGMGGMMQPPPEEAPPEQPPTDFETQQGAPQPPRGGASEQKRRDYRRSLEEWRYKQNYRNDAEMSDRIERLRQEDSPAGARERERQAFFEDLKATAFSRTNGKVSALPKGRPRVSLK